MKIFGNRNTYLRALRRKKHLRNLQCNIVYLPIISIVKTVLPVQSTAKNLIDPKYLNNFITHEVHRPTRCSRRMAELQEQGITDIALHCDSEGNYESLQCGAGMCWCVDRITGEIEDTVLPESSISKLKCYNKDEVGKQYLRICESQLVGQRELLQKLKYHGTDAESMIPINCGFDGSYGPVQFFGTIAACTAKDNSKIKTYQSESIQYATMDCHCAQDEMIFSAAGMNFQLACQVNGNYEATQELGGQLFCVDSDGYPISKMFDSTEKVDCSNWIYELVAH